MNFWRRANGPAHHVTRTARRPIRTAAASRNVVGRRHHAGDQGQPVRHPPHPLLLCPSVDPAPAPSPPPASPRTVATARHFAMHRCAAGQPRSRPARGRRTAAAPCQAAAPFLKAEGSWVESKGAAPAQRIPLCCAPAACCRAHRSDARLLFWYPRSLDAPAAGNVHGGGKHGGGKTGGESKPFFYTGSYVARPLPEILSALSLAPPLVQLPCARARQSPHAPRRPCRPVELPHLLALSLAPSLPRSLAPSLSRPASPASAQCLRDQTPARTAVQAAHSTTRPPPPACRQYPRACAPRAGRYALLPRHLPYAQLEEERKRSFDDGSSELPEHNTGGATAANVFASAFGCECASATLHPALVFYPALSLALLRSLTRSHAHTHTHTHTHPHTRCASLPPSPHPPPPPT